MTIGMNCLSCFNIFCYYYFVFHLQEELNKAAVNDGVPTKENKRNGKTHHSILLKVYILVVFASFFLEKK